jgi:hypothetical protein
VLAGYRLSAEELPPAVTSREYSDFCRRNYTAVSAERDKLIKLATSYDRSTRIKAFDPT